MKTLNAVKTKNIKAKKENDTLNVINNIEISKGIKALFMVVIGSFSLPAFPATIELFVKAPITVVPIPGHSVVLQDLSAPSRVAQNAPSLSADPAAARRQALSFFNSPEGKRYQQRMKAAYQPKKRAMELRLKKVPAVVFEDGRYVVYGTIDIEEALRDYHNYKKHETSSPQPTGAHR